MDIDRQLLIDQNMLDAIAKKLQAYTDKWSRTEGPFGLYHYEKREKPHVVRDFRPAQPSLIGCDVVDSFESREEAEAYFNKLTARYYANVALESVLDVLNDEYVVFCLERQQWWKSNRIGYTSYLSKAGRYTREEAIRICRDANLKASDGVNEIMMTVRDAYDIEVSEEEKDLFNREHTEDCYSSAVGKFKVVGVDTFDGTEWSEGEFDTLKDAMIRAREKGGSMVKMHVYDHEGNHKGEAGNF